MLSVCIPEIFGNFFGTGRFYRRKESHAHDVHTKKNRHGQFPTQIGCLMVHGRGTFIKWYWVLPSLIFRSSFEYFGRITIISAIWIKIKIKEEIIIHIHMYICIYNMYVCIHIYIGINWLWIKIKIVFVKSSEKQDQKEPFALFEGCSADMNQCLFSSPFKNLWRANENWIFGKLI